MFQAAIFDLDGLLIDSEPLWRKAEVEVFGHYGLELTENDCLQTTGLRLPEVVDLWAEKHPPLLLKKTEIVSQIFSLMERAVAESATVKDGALAAISCCVAQGLKIAIASSSPEILIRAAVQRLKIESVLESFASAEYELEGKPHPAVYLTAARNLGVEPEGCIAFEDSPRGVEAALRAGMFCVFVPEGNSSVPLNQRVLRLNSLKEFHAGFLEMKPG